MNIKQICEEQGISAYITSQISSWCLQENLTTFNSFPPLKFDLVKYISKKCHITIGDSGRFVNGLTQHKQIEYEKSQKAEEERLRILEVQKVENERQRILEAQKVEAERLKIFEAQERLRMLEAQKAEDERISIQKAERLKLLETPKPEQTITQQDAYEKLKLMESQKIEQRLLEVLKNGQETIKLVEPQKEIKIQDQQRLKYVPKNELEDVFKPFSYLVSVKSGKKYNIRDKDVLSETYNSGSEQRMTGPLIFFISLSRGYSIDESSVWKVETFEKFREDFYLE